MRRPRGNAGLGQVLPTRMRFPLCHPRAGAWPHASTYPVLAAGLGGFAKRKAMPTGGNPAAWWQTVPVGMVHHSNANQAAPDGPGSAGHPWKKLHLMKFTIPCLRPAAPCWAIRGFPPSATSASASRCSTSVTVSKG